MNRIAKIAAIALASFFILHSSLAQTPVLFSLRGLTGMANNRTITLTPDVCTNALISGTNLMALYPIVLNPAGGQVITNLTPWGYSLLVDGWPRPNHIIVPVNTNVLNVISLFNPTLFDTTNFTMLSTFLPGANITFVTNTDLSITISSTGGSGGGGGSASTNGLASTNWVGQNFALITSIPVVQPTNGLAATNWVGSNFYLTANPSGYQTAAQVGTAIAAQNLGNAAAGNTNTMTVATSLTAWTATNAPNGTPLNNLVYALTNSAFAEVFTNGTYIVGGVAYQTNPFSVIQAAVDRLPYYATKAQAGGGTINLQAGIFQLTNTINFTNNNIASWMLVGAGNNATVIQANGIYEAIHVDSSPTNDANLNFSMERLAVVNTTNCQTNLVYISHGSKDRFHDCCFYGWQAWTNNGLYGIQPGLYAAVTPIAPSGLIGIYDIGSEGDRIDFDYCNFGGLAVSIFSDSDHPFASECDFQCDSYWVSNGTGVFGNSWTNKSLYSTGFQIGHISGIQQMFCKDNYFYNCLATDFGAVSADNDIIESSEYSFLNFRLFNVFTKGLLAVESPAGLVGTNGSGVYSITTPSLQPGVGYNDGGVNDGVNMLFGSFTSDGNDTPIAGFDGNGLLFGSGAQLTGLNASQLTSGTIPLSQLSGITSNQLDAATWKAATNPPLTYAYANLTGAPTLGNASVANTNTMSVAGLLPGASITNAAVSGTFTGNGAAVTNGISWLQNPATNFSLAFNGTEQSYTFTVTNVVNFTNVTGSAGSICFRLTNTPVFYNPNANALTWLTTHPVVVTNGIISFTQFGTNTFAAYLESQ